MWIFGIHTLLVPAFLWSLPCGDLDLARSYLMETCFLMETWKVAPQGKMMKTCHSSPPTHFKDTQQIVHVSTKETLWKPYLSGSHYLLETHFPRSVTCLHRAPLWRPDLCDRSVKKLKKICLVRATNWRSIEDQLCKWIIHFQPMKLLDTWLVCTDGLPTASLLPHKDTPCIYSCSSHVFGLSVSNPSESFCKNYV
jgi:hypothetical protein